MVLGLGFGARSPSPSRVEGSRLFKGRLQSCVGFSLVCAAGNCLYQNKGTLFGLVPVSGNLEPEKGKRAPLGYRQLP